MARNDGFSRDEIAEYIDTERRLERLDRRLRARKAVSITFVALLLCCLTVYAVRIERKLTELSEQQPVVIYMNTGTTAESDEAVPLYDESTHVLYEETTSSSEADDNTEVSEKQEITTEETTSVKETTAEAVIDSSVNSVADDKVTPEEETVTGSTTQHNISSVYYVTKTGTKYHRSGCAHLSKSKIPMSYDEIVAKGYKPCSKCIS